MSLQEDPIYVQEHEATNRFLSNLENLQLEDDDEIELKLIDELELIDELKIKKTSKQNKNKLEDFSKKIPKQRRISIFAPV